MVTVHDAAGRARAHSPSRVSRKTWIGSPFSPRLIPLCAGLAMGLAALAVGAEPDPADQVALARRMRPAILRVEYTLRYDRGDEPSGAGEQYICPNCGRPHYRADGPELIRDERPLVTEGFLIAATRVVAPDVAVHERFIGTIRVGHGAHRVDARVTGYGIEQDAVFLELAAALPGCTPLSFDADAPRPYFAINHGLNNGRWTTTVVPLATNVTLSDALPPVLTVPANTLIVDGNGRAVALSMNPQIPIDDTWKRAPDQWPQVSTAERSERLAALTERTRRGLRRVQLNFRSPPMADAQSPLTMMGQYEPEENATEIHCIGVLVGARRVLVLAHLDPGTTARLERVRVFDDDGQARPAQFVATLADHGALVARLEEPMDGALALAPADLQACRHRMLPAARVKVLGEERVAHHGHERLSQFEVGWHQRAYPVSYTASDLFLFDDDDRLLALPITRRRKVAVDEPWTETEEATLTPAAEVASILGDLSEHTDEHNVPLSPEQEMRLAWMGVVLQPLDRELARANQVAEFTHDGECGALVTHVYPGSPAAEAGVTQGDILLRLQVDGQPRPIDILIEPIDDGLGFEWEQLDQVPEQYFEHVPRPWPSAANAFTWMLTDLGPGTKYTAAFVVGNRHLDRSFVVTMGPPHFDSARRFKSDALGLTVRDLTYEVRHYLQMRAEDPGVIISRIEPGSRAAVGGLKPFETITAVDQIAVRSAEHFERQIEGADELLLSVRRMGQSRQVRIRPGNPRPGARP